MYAYKIMSAKVAFQENMNPLVCLHFKTQKFNPQNLIHHGTCVCTCVCMCVHPLCRWSLCTVTVVTAQLCVHRLETLRNFY